MLVLVLVLILAATAVAYGSPVMTEAVTAVAGQMAGGTLEPAAMLLSGSLLLGLAGAVRRFTV